MEQATNTVLETGVVGAIAVILLGAVIVLWRENKQLQEKLYTDAKETATASINAANAVANSITGLTDKIETIRRER